jgi:carbon monoxide dehydrogenase subunit G
MARFESRNVSTASVAAPRADIWAIVTSPDALAELTPLIDRISADGDRWCWQLKRISALGVHVEPSFTELMTFDDGQRMTFEHQPPPGKSEVAGAHGVYELADRTDGGTDLSVDITIHVELPLPSISRRAVQRVMASMMARTGDKFAENLYARLGISPDSAAKLQRVEG